VVAEPPSPLFDLGEDWIFRSFGAGVFSPQSFENGGGSIDSYQSRAMRKLPEGRGILGVLQISNFNESDANWLVHFALEVRFFLKAGAYRV